MKLPILFLSIYPTLENRLFGDFWLSKNADIDKYGYANYGIRFDRKGFFSHLLDELAEI